MNDWHATAVQRLTIAAMAVAAVACGLWLVRAEMADAACAAPTMEPAVEVAPAGSHLRVTGDGWRTCVDTLPSDDEPVPYRDIHVLLRQGATEHDLGVVGANAAGHVDGTVMVPQRMAPGEYQLTGRTGDESAGSVPRTVAVTSGDRAASRVGGADRVATAVLVSQRNFPAGAPTVYLARADVPYDAMVAGTATDGPILLVPGCDLPESVAAEIARVAPSELVALGGETAMCPAVLDEAAKP